MSEEQKQDQVKRLELLARKNSDEIFGCFPPVSGARSMVVKSITAARRSDNLRIIVIYADYGLYRAEDDGLDYAVMKCVPALEATVEGMTDEQVESGIVKSFDSRCVSREELFQPQRLCVLETDVLCRFPNTKS